MRRNGPKVSYPPLPDGMERGAPVTHIEIISDDGPLRLPVKGDAGSLQRGIRAIVSAPGVVPARIVREIRALSGDIVVAAGSDDRGIFVLTSVGVDIACEFQGEPA